VDAALEAERLEVRVERFAVVADLLDDVERPAVIVAGRVAYVASRADEALHAGVLARERLVDRLGREPHLLGLDHRKQRPLHDVEPAVVALTHRRPAATPQRPSWPAH